MSWRSAPTLPVIIDIWGLGCSPSRSRMYRARMAAALHPIPYHVLCDSTSSALGDVVKTFCSLRPSTSKPFVRKAAALARAYLHAGRPVVLLGTSYGGSVAARVAELLRGDPASARLLHVATFGAIYAPPPAATAGVDVVHFMRPNDVALRCNGLRAPAAAATSSVFDERTGVFWVRAERESNVRRRRPRVLSKRTWRLHNMYGRYAHDIMYVWAGPEPARIKDLARHWSGR